MLDKNAKKNYNSNFEVVNGRITSKSFKTYSNIQNPKNKYNLRTLALLIILTALIIASLLVFANSIKTAYFDDSKETQEINANIEKIKIHLDKNKTIKVENVTKEIADVFGLPVGVKVIEIAEDSLVSSLLKINDIIVKVSGKTITNIDQLNSIIEDSEYDEFLTYTVYRNGTYHIIDPNSIEIE